MRLIAVGLSHRTAPVAVRERFAADPDRLRDLAATLRDRFRESFVVATCLRVEIYAVAGHTRSGSDRAVEALRSLLPAGVELEDDPFYRLADRDAATHLIRVAAGLDSRVVGESEILGQVRRALAAAGQLGTLGPVLHRLGAIALGTAKAIRSSQGPDDRGSMAAMALDPIPTSARRVLLIGAGAVATSALRALRRRTVDRLVIVNRTDRRAVALGERFGVTAGRWRDLESHLTDANLVIVAAGADAPILRAGQIGVRDAATWLVDLGVPRGIDPEVATLPRVSLSTVDDIATAPAPSDDEALVAAGADEFERWWRGRAVVPAITSLTAQASTIAREEVSRALQRLGTLTPRQRAEVERLGHRMAGRLIDRPIRRMRLEPDGAALAATASRLFAADADSLR